MSAPRASSFYVGYLPLPGAHRHGLRILVPALMGLIGALGAAFAIVQRDPGAAVWDTSRLREWSGVIHVVPYPLLIDDADDSALLIVEQGKRGPRQAAHTSGRAHVRGWMLERDGRRMIELDPADDALRIEATTTTQTLASEGQSVELVGEILDAKCYLGAMKPGDGKTHKACATLCIQGGIPPMLYVDEPNGQRTHYLIVGPDGSSAANIVRPFIAEPVRIRGRVSRLADLDVMVLEPDGVSRL